jgi:Ni,Fe-hydrogenase I large subunit
VYQGALDAFWESRPTPDAEMARNFIEQLLHLTQVPCHAYALRASPLAWQVPPHLRDIP